MYKTQRAGNKVWTRKANEVWELQRVIGERIIELGLKAPKQAFCYTSHTCFYFSRSDWLTKEGNLKKIDLTNLFKPIEDAIFGSGNKEVTHRGLDIDDCKGIYNTQEKCFLPEGWETPPYYVAVSLTFYEKRSYEQR
jgi:hypothetical protein